MSQHFWTFQHLSEVTCSQAPLFVKVHVKSIAPDISRYPKIGVFKICCFLVVAFSFWISPGFNKGTEFCGFLRQCESGNGHLPESLRYGVSLMLVPHVSSLVELFLGWGRCFSFTVLVPLVCFFCFGFREFQKSYRLSHDHFHLNTSPISICITNGWSAEASSHG